jgi:hypothetical protein
MTGASSMTRSAGTSPTIGAADLRLLAEPLDYLETEHYRLRAVLSLLERIGTEPKPDVRVATARLVADFIASDLALHVIDEEDGLFPLLRERCEVSDGLERILRVVADEPSRGSDARETLALELGAANLDRPLPGGVRAMIGLFVESQRRLLAWEDAFVLPLARRRLTVADKSWLSCKMRERRK